MKAVHALVQITSPLKVLATLALIGTLLASPASAGEQGQIGVYDVNVSHGLTFTGKQGDAPAPLALRGYDTVSYFTEGRPQLGTVQHAVVHNGAIYWFASDRHKEIFVENPDRYLPQYGGFCAFGVTQNTKFDGDPLLWNVHQDKLYLNVTPDLQAKWLGKGLIGSSLEDNVTAADQIWPEISDAKPQALFMAWLAKQ